MQFKQGNSRLVAGRLVSDAKYTEVGDKKTPKCTLGVAWGPKEAEGGGITNVVAWGTLAKECKRGRKGDHAIAGGQTESHEYNGRTYNNLRADFALVVCAADYAQDTLLDGFTETEVNEDELPF